MIGKDLIGIENLTRGEIETILETATRMQEVGKREIKKVPSLRGRTIINLFFEDSTRTRSSFEIAGKRLSADVVNFSPSNSSLNKAESILDTAGFLCKVAEIVESANVVWMLLEAAVIPLGRLLGLLLLFVHVADGDRIDTVTFDQCSIGYRDCMDSHQ